MRNSKEKTVNLNTLTGEALGGVTCPVCGQRNVLEVYGSWIMISRKSKCPHSVQVLIPIDPPEKVGFLIPSSEPTGEGNQIFIRERPNSRR